MTWTPYDTWIVITGALCAGSCALLGNFLVLRRMSMMGDAISHAVLPGLAMAFVLTGSRASLSMFIGAAVVGVLTAIFTEWIRHLGKVEESAAMGVVFTSLFALGLLLIRQTADHVDLDPGCVLYGAIEFTPFDRISVAGMEVPRAAAVLSCVLLLNVCCVVIFYKELKISSFDPGLATTLGINARAMHYLLMTLVAVTTVAAFESVGSILVVAMLIVPGATAHLLTDRLSSMLVVSLVLAGLTSVLGHAGAIMVPPWFGFDDTSSTGTMAVVTGLLFLVTMLVAPRHGVFSKMWRRMQLSLQIAREDVLSLLWRLEESNYRNPELSLRKLLHDVFGVGPVISRLALASLERQGLIAQDAEGYRLTAASRDNARQLVRTHRLWETYLAKYLHLPADHVHAPADRVEHYTSEPMAEALTAELREHEADPHGHPIPHERKNE
jgi:manganese/zinc/iron transport system permease protein